MEVLQHALDWYANQVVTDTIVFIAYYYLNII